MARLLAGQAVERTDAAKNGAGTLPLTGVSQQLVAANKDRVALYVSSNSANPMWIALGAPAVVSAGIRIPASSTVGPITAYTGAVNIIGTNLDVASFAEV